MRRTTLIPLAAVAALGLAGIAVGQTTATSTLGATSGTMVLVESGAGLDAQTATESETLGVIAAERAETARDAGVAEDLLEAVKAERGDIAERATRDAERIALEKAAAEAAAKAAAEAAAAAEAEAERLASASPRDIGQVLAAERGWTGGQWSCLDSLWTRESNWNPQADNPTSSAFGIPQALPGSKMSTAGSDWATNPATQIAWGLGYIASRYGTPCSAWGHSESHNWY